MIALFVKPPVPGRVKTRLARDIGDTAACAVYRKLAEGTIRQIQASGIPLALFYDGTLSRLPETWQQAAQICYPQQGNDLGQRMAAAFCKGFTDGAEQIVLIGSDIPGLDASYICSAFELLDAHDLVIGPALDGGYCLIGFRRESFTSILFENIPWSTGQVLKRTLSAATTAGLSIGALHPLQDLDNLDDLRKLDSSGVFCRDESEPV